LGANFNADILFCGSDLQHGSTGTPNGGIIILRMDVSFHFISTPRIHDFKDRLLYMNNFDLTTINLHLGIAIIRPNPPLLLSIH